MASKTPTKKKSASKKAPSKKSAAKKKPAAKKKSVQKSASPKESSSGEVLDLLEPKPKKKRSRAERAAARKAEEEKAQAPKDEKSELDKQKEEALNLFEEQERKSKKKKSAKKVTETKVSSSISLKGDSQPKPKDEEEEAKEEAADQEEGEAKDKVIHLKPPIIIKDLANEMDIKPLQLIKDLMGMEIFASVNKAVEPDIAEKLCEIHGFTFEKEKREKGAGVHKVEEVIEEPPAPEPETEPEDETIIRAPVVTVMGHVDHGKTTLLDTIRKARVAAGEAGGITQHINAYQVHHNGHPITFIDTPGHQAFTEMRQRGAQVTDLVILVIAADDGIMPTTKEAIAHAKAADVTIMVAINKCDLPNADINKVKQQLQAIDLAPEEWGGHTICAEISALKEEGIDELLDLVALQAEILELKANPTAPARATVIEARTEKGKGPTAQVIVTSGTLTVGMPFICGLQFGKIRALVDDSGERLKEAGPSMPIEVQGFDGVPSVGDEVVQMKNEREAKKLGTERQMSEREEQLKHDERARLENMFDDVGTGKRALLRLVLKTDVQGSAEAIVNSLKDIKTEKVKLDILHSAAGPITESDIVLASASDAIVIGFNQKVEGKAVKVAKQHGVQVKLFSIIYELVDQVKEAMLGKLDPELRENILGHAEVKMVFKVSKGKAAGCLVKDGKITRKARARVLREDQPVYDGGMDTLRRFQDDVSEVKKGLECGIRLGNFNDYEEGDIIEAYELEKVAQTL